MPLLKESNAGRSVHKIKETMLKNRLPSIPGIFYFQAETLTRQQSASKQHKLMQKKKKLKNKIILENHIILLLHSLL